MLRSSKFNILSGLLLWPTLIQDAFAVPTEKRANVIEGISQDLYNRFDKMASITAGSPLGTLCVKPGGFEKVYTISNTTTDINGWIVIDTVGQEIIVTFRGTQSIQNFNTDDDDTLTPFYGDGIDCSDCLVHHGFFTAWQSVSAPVITEIQNQLNAYPGFGVVMLGHSLGGALASLSAAQVVNLFPNVTAFTMGQPRTGNPAYANYVDSKFGSGTTGRMYRSTHANDGVPQEPTQADGFQHHSTEYWNRDPTGANNTWICLGQDSTDCNGGAGGSGINAAHLTYYGHTVVIGADCT